MFLRQRVKRLAGELDWLARTQLYGGLCQLLRLVKKLGPSKGLVATCLASRRLTDSHFLPRSLDSLRRHGMDNVDVVVDTKR